MLVALVPFLSCGTEASRVRLTEAPAQSAELVQDGDLSASGSSPYASAETNEHSAAAREAPVDLVRLYKSERRLVLYALGAPQAEYRVALGSRPIGPKREEGDGRTPEGQYVIDWRKLESDYHRALHISYPNPEDRRRAKARSVDPGGSIMIHGLPNGFETIGSNHTLSDWTDGCVAVTNEEMEEIWEQVADGVPIEILP